MKGLIIKSTGKYSLVKVDEKIYKCLLRGNFRLDNNLSNPVVSGDTVEIELDKSQNGVITKVLERENQFIKKSLKDNKAHIIGSNIDQILIISSLKAHFFR